MTFQDLGNIVFRAVLIDNKYLFKGSKLFLRKSKTLMLMRLTLNRFLLADLFIWHRLD